MLLAMKMTGELLRFDQVDADGYTFSPSAFSGSEGKQFPMNFAFNRRRFAGVATIRSTESALVCDFDSEALANIDAPADPRFAIGFKTIKSSMTEGIKTVIEAEATDLGVVKAEDIIT
jgi:hypothetical protein